MDKTSTERSPKRMDGYIDELKSVLADKGLECGRPQDLVPVADMLRVPGAVREDLAAAIRSILSRETGGLSRAQVASMLAMAVGGTGLYVTSQEVDAVGRLDEFADWVMAPSANVALGGDAVAQAVEPFWGVVGTSAGEKRGAPVGLGAAFRDVRSEGRVDDGDAYPTEALPASAKRSNAPWVMGACAVLVLITGGLVWRYQQAPRAGVEASTTKAVSAIAQPVEMPGAVSAAREAAAQVLPGSNAAVGLTSESSLASTNSGKPSASKLGERGSDSAGAMPTREGIGTVAVKPSHRQGEDVSPLPKGTATIPTKQHLAQASKPAPLTASSAAAPASAGPTGKFLVSSGVMSGHLITAPEPSYPKMAKMWGIHGEVVLQAVISRNGQVVAAHAMDGHKLLRGAAEHSVKKWRYRPYLRNGKPTDVDTVVIVDFHLPS